METKTVQMQVRKPTRAEVINTSGNGLRFGIVYFVESDITPGTFCGMLRTGIHTDQKEFSSWYKQGRVWVPHYAIDNKIELLTQKTEI